MIEVKETNEQLRSDLLKLWEISHELVERFSTEFPSRRVNVEINGDEENYWIDGKCYTISRRFYLPD